MTIEKEITALSKQWMNALSNDYHKDRDCHWFIETIWSYGEDPYYQAHHGGYILETWTSPKCETAELAQTLLRDKLKKELHALSHMS